MNTPGINHVILTVTDLERSTQFYHEVLGFDVQPIPPEYGKLAYFQVGAASIWLIQHDQTPPNDRFSEFRVGLDHLSFRAPDRAALHDLAERLRAAGVDTNGVEVYQPSGKPYIVFRDPDNIQLEYWLDESEA